MRRAPLRGGEISLLIASGILVVYGLVMTAFNILAALVLGLLRAISYYHGEGSPFFNIMWLFVAVTVLYVALGLTLYKGFRPLYFLTIGLVSAMSFYHGYSLSVINEVGPFMLAAFLMAVNLVILLFLAYGYPEVESGTEQRPFWQMLRDRRYPREVVCTDCGSHSVNEIRPGVGLCSFCGQLVTYPVGTS